MKIDFLAFRPPRIAQLFVVIAFLLHWFTPLQTVQVFHSEKSGILLGIIGFSIMMSAWWLFKKANTGICPTTAASYLVINGVFRFSRNPMYFGMVSMLCAFAFYFGSVPFYLATVAFFCVINFVFCPYEESKLEAEIGQQYLTYKSKVRRWL